MSLEGSWDTDAIRKYNTVDEIKNQLRKGNSNYLCKHPEIRAIIRVILHHAINKQPKQINQYVAELFNMNTNPILITMINQQLKQVNGQLRKSRYHAFDGDLLFAENPSSHSLVSETSLTATADSILRYCIVLDNSKVNK